MNICYSYEGRPLGTAVPLYMVEGLDSTFMVMDGDVLTTLDFNSLVDYYRESGAAATIAMHSRTVKVNLGVIQRDGGNEVTAYFEKPSYDFQASMGINVFEPRVLDYIPWNDHFDFPDFVHSLIKNGQKAVGFLFEGYWEDLGRPDDYEEAVRDFESLKPQLFGEMD